MVVRALAVDDRKQAVSDLVVVDLEDGRLLDALMVDVQLWPATGWPTGADGLEALCQIAA